MRRAPREPLPPPDRSRRVFMAAVAGSLLAAPRAGRAQEAGKTYTVGLVSIGTDPGQLGLWQPFIGGMQEGGYVEGRNLVVKRAFGNPDRLAGMLAELVAARVDAIVTTGPRETRTARRATATLPIVMTFVEDPGAGRPVRPRRALGEAALKHRLPGIYWAREYGEAGGLLTYGAGLVDLRRHAAIYVDKILRGARPADLPTTQPTKFDLVINMKTAKALGLTIPPSLLVRADQVIE